MAFPYKYKVLALRPGLTKPIELLCTSSPKPERVANWLHRKGWINPDPVHADSRRVLTTRYYPSRKGWVISDFTRAYTRQLYHNAGVLVWVGHSRGTKVYQSEDVAVMVMLHLLNPPEQTTLNV